MDRRIRHLAALVTTLLLAVAVTAGWVQGINAEQIATNEPVNPRNPEERARNRFRIFQECRWERGPILSADGQALADTVPVPDGRRCLFQRVYPMGDLAPHVVGQWSLHYGKSGLESAYNQELIGDPIPPTSIAEFFQQRPRLGNTLVSTIDTRLQQATLEALRGRRGGVVAMNPKSGAVLVAASVPSYDPNPLASNDRTVADQARCQLGISIPGQDVECLNPHAPMVSLALQSRRPPGSTYKVVAAAAALESGHYTPTSPSVPASGSYLAPGDTRPIRNYGGGVCGGNLTQALAASCNTAFARIAVDVGAEQLFSTAAAMGLDQHSGPSFVGCEARPVADVQETRTGCMPRELERPDGTRERLETAGYRARAGFGQWVIQTSPFGMALVAATAANDGVMPRPRFADRVIDRRGETIREIRTGMGAAALSPEAAVQLKDMMRRVVTGGTASRAFGGFRVPSAGKTGTAQQPTCDAQEQAIFGPGCERIPHAWYIGFAPMDDPTIAVAVLIERTGTGGQFAAPVARQVMESYFQLYPAAAGGEGP